MPGPEELAAGCDLQQMHMVCHCACRWVAALWRSSEVTSTREGQERDILLHIDVLQGPTHSMLQSIAWT